MFMANAIFAVAERGGAGRLQMLIDAKGWMLLADHLDFIDTAMAKARRQRLH
jgi:hypothetical protein